MLDADPAVPAAEAPGAFEAEAAQPLYARYWLHNRGPAPLGGLPAVVHLQLQQLTAAPGDEVALRLTVAGDSSDAALCGTITVICPDLWSATPDQLPFTLQPGEYREADVVVRVPPGTLDGRYPVRAQLGLTGDDVPRCWRQVVEDVCMVSVGAPSHGEPLRLVGSPADVELALGEAGRLRVTVATDACADLSLEAHLISPWDTWEWIGPATLGAVLPARGTVDLDFDVTPPAWQQPGQWWALVRIGCAGRLVYSRAVKVTVR